MVNKKGAIRCTFFILNQFKYQLIFVAKQKTKTFAFILLLITLFQSVGYIGMFQVWQIKIKREIKFIILKGIKNEELTLLKIPLKFHTRNNPDFQFEETDEFSYYGEMYDIVRKEHHADTIWYYCLQDRDETLLISSINILIEKQLGQNSSAQHHTEQFFAFSELQYLIEYQKYSNSPANNVEYFPQNIPLYSDPIPFSIFYPPEVNPFI